MFGWLKSVANAFAPKQVLREVTLQPNRTENDGERVLAQVCQANEGEVFVVLRAEDGTTLELRVTDETPGRLRELLTAVESAANRDPR